jgi:catechol 2,3-dioxygenase-like lactoylglutathione lyase family enzyme
VTSATAKIAFEGSQPILGVGNLEASVDYYVNALGFKLDFRDAIASVSRGRCAIFLVEGDQGNPGTWAWVGVDDVDALQVVESDAGRSMD